MVRQSNILVQRKIPKATGQRLMCCGNDKNRRTKHIVLFLHSIVKKTESEKQVKSDTACFFGGKLAFICQQTGQTGCKL